MNFWPIKGYFFASYTFRAINGPIVPQKMGKKPFKPRKKYKQKFVYILFGKVVYLFIFEVLRSANPRLLFLHSRGALQPP